MSENAVNQQPVTGEQTTTETVEQTQTTQAETAEQLQERIKNMESALKKANKEAEDRRKKLDAFELKEQEAAAAKLSETEKMQAKIAELEKQKNESVKLANERLVKAAVLSSSINFIDADAAYALLDKSKIEIDENGTVKGVQEALDELGKAKPALLKAKTNPALNVTNPGAKNNAAPTDAQWREFMNGGKLPV